jgi:hypothetical protein
VFGANTPSTPFSHSTPISTNAYSQRTASTSRSIFGNAGVHASGDGRAGTARFSLSLGEIGSGTSSAASKSPCFGFWQPTKPLKPSSEADATKASGPAARSAKRPKLALVDDYQSIRAVHYSFDPLTLPLYIYMSELSKVPVAASSKADASDGRMEVNPDYGLCAPITNEATGSEEIRPWTPYYRRSIPAGDSFAGSKGIRQVNPVNATSFPLSSETVDNTETREMNPGQELRALPRDLLVDSMVMALLLEVNHILEQERRANIEISVRVVSKATSTCDEMRQVNPNDGRRFSIRDDATGRDAVGQVNYFCCDWW